MLLSRSTSDSGGVSAAEFLARYGIPSGQTADWSFFAWFGSWLLQLPAIVLVLHTAIKALHRIWTLRYSPTLLTLSVLVLLPAAGAVWVAVQGSGWGIPVQYLPMQWSDLEFWSRQWKTIQQSIVSLAQLPCTVWETTFWASFFNSIFCAAVAAILAAILTGRIQKYSEAQFFWSSLAWWIGWFTLSFLFDSAAAIPRFLWLGFPVYMLSELGLQKHEYWLLPENCAERRI